MTRTRDLATALLLVAVLGATGCGAQTAESLSAGGAEVSGADTGPEQGARGEADSEATGTSDDARVVRLQAGAAKPDLVCPTDERSMMIADFAHGAKGAATPEEAVGDGLVEAGEQLVVSASGATAWVLRPDGTARMEVGLIRHDGWLLHQRTSCG